MIHIPQSTTLGFKIFDVPTTTWELIQECYSKTKDLEYYEHWEGKEHFITGTGNTTVFPIGNFPEYGKLIHSQLHQLHQEWCGYEIEPSFVYGIRSYKEGAKLETHVDRIETHHISSIILVDKDLDNQNDWGLNITDHDGNNHIVYLEPGEMILYESAICEHGRMEPFKGNFYNNLFVHYKFKDYKHIN